MINRNSSNRYLILSFYIFLISFLLFSFSQTIFNLKSNYVQKDILSPIAVVRVGFGSKPLDTLFNEPLTPTLKTNPTSILKSSKSTTINYQNEEESIKEGNQSVVYVNQQYTGLSDGSLQMPYKDISIALDNLSYGGNLILTSDYVLERPILIDKQVNIYSDKDKSVLFIVNDSFLCSNPSGCVVLDLLNEVSINNIQFVVDGSYITYLIKTNAKLQVNSSSFIDTNFEMCANLYDESLCNSSVIFSSNEGSSILNSYFQGFTNHYIYKNKGGSFIGGDLTNNYFANAYGSSVLLDKTQNVKLLNNIFFNNQMSLNDNWSSKALLVGNFFYGNGQQLLFSNTSDSFVFGNSFNNKDLQVTVKGDATDIKFYGPQENTTIGNYWDGFSDYILLNEDIYVSSRTVSSVQNLKVIDPKPLVGKNLISKHYVSNFDINSFELVPGEVAYLEFKKDYAIDFLDSAVVVLENSFSNESYNVEGVVFEPKKIAFRVPNDISVGSYKITLSNSKYVLPSMISIVILDPYNASYQKYLPINLTMPEKLLIPQTEPINNIEAVHNLEDNSISIIWSHNKTLGFEDQDVYTIYRLAYPKSRAMRYGFIKTKLASVANTNQYKEANKNVLNNDYFVYEYKVEVENRVTGKKASLNNSNVIEVYPFLIDNTVEHNVVGIGAGTKVQSIKDIALSNLMVANNGLIDTYYIWDNKNKYYKSYIEDMSFYDYLQINPYEPFLISTKRYVQVPEKYFLILTGLSDITFPKLELTQGNNPVLITHKHKKLIYASDLLASIPNAVSVSQMEYTSNPTYKKGSPLEHNFVLQAGSGYFVEVSKDTTWQYVQ